MVLGVEHLGVGPVAGDLVDALVELRVGIGAVGVLDADVGGRPGVAAVLGAIDAARAHRDDHAVRVGGVRQDGVDRAAAEALAPVRPVRVLPQATDELEGAARVAAAPQRLRLGARPHDVLVEGVGHELPHPLERDARVLGEPDGVRRLRLEGPAEVVGDPDIRPPVPGVAADQQGGPARPLVEGDGRDLLHGQEGPLDVPGASVVATRAGGDEQALAGADGDDGSCHDAMFTPFTSMRKRQPARPARRPCLS